MVVESVDIKEDLAHLIPARQADWDAAIRATSSFEFEPIDNVTHSLKSNDVVFIKGNPASSGFVQSKQGSVIGLSKYTLSGYTTIKGLEALTPRHSPETTYPIIPVLAAVTHGDREVRCSTLLRKLSELATVGCLRAKTGQFLCRQARLVQVTAHLRIHGSPPLPED